MMAALIPALSLLAILSAAALALAPHSGRQGDAVRVPVEMRRSA